MYPFISHLRLCRSHSVMQDWDTWVGLAAMQKGGRMTVPSHLGRREDGEVHDHLRRERQLIGRRGPWCLPRGRAAGPHELAHVGQRQGARQASEVWGPPPEFSFLAPGGWGRTVPYQETLDAWAVLARCLKVGGRKLVAGPPSGSQPWLESRRPQAPVQSRLPERTSGAPNFGWGPRRQSHDSSRRFLLTGRCLGLRRPGVDATGAPETFPPVARHVF